MSARSKTVIAWVCRIIAAVIMLQTLFFKFTAAPESVYIFSALGMEPWGRIGTGILELTASVLILLPAATVYGAVLGLGLMGGALFFHFTRLGIVVQDDSGQLFIYAFLVFISCLVLLMLYKEQAIRLLTIFKRSK
jgi:uncharacterized membrane protein YphA (DoxX/SURF4 family)